MSLPDVRREVEWRKCRDDVRHFLRNYCHAVSRDGMVKFEPFDYQLDLLDHIESTPRGRHLLVLKGRQIGFSAIMGAVMAHRCLFFEHQKCHVGSKRGEEAEKILSDATSQILRRLPEWMLERGPRQTAASARLLSWSNGSEMRAFPADEPARGHTPTVLFLDEWAFAPNPDRAWNAAINAVEHRGLLVAGSSANGHGTMFHDQWLHAKQGTSNLTPLFYGWQVHPHRDPDTFLADAMRLVNGIAWKLHQEHPSEPEEAFAMSGRWLFDPAVLDAQRVSPPSLCAVTPGGLVADTSGHLRVWQHPEPGRHYAIGADVAQGVAGGDFTCAQVLRDDGLQVAVWHGHIDVDLFAGQLDSLGRLYNDALIGCESNTPGDGVNRWLRSSGYPRLYRRRDHEKRWEEPTEKLGWHTNKQTKPLAVNTAVKDLREGGLMLQDADTVREMRAFVAVGEGAAMKMEGAPFDDRVDAVCIAAKMREFSHTETWAPPPPGPAPGTRDWWAQIDSEQAWEDLHDPAPRSHMRKAAMR